MSIISIGFHRAAFGARVWVLDVGRADGAEEVSWETGMQICAWGYVAPQRCFRQDTVHLQMVLVLSTTERRKSYDLWGFVHSTNQAQNDFVLVKRTLLGDFKVFRRVTPRIIFKIKYTCIALPCCWTTECSFRFFKYWFDHQGGDCRCRIAITWHMELYGVGWLEHRWFCIAIVEVGKCCRKGSSNLVYTFFVRVVKSIF